LYACNICIVALNKAISSFHAYTGGLQKGWKVLIHAAGSGVGQAAIQLTTLAGSEAIATAGTEEKLDAARKLGAVAGINYKTEDFSERVLELTEGTHILDVSNVCSV